MALTGAATSTHAAPESDPQTLQALLAELARPAPAGVDFVEVRESALLDTPVRVSGRLERPDDRTLVREVHVPQRERTTIRDERVEIEREDGRTRSFGLNRAPELRGLLASFRGVLGGDPALLEEHYATALSTAEDGRWSLGLNPRDPRLARHVRQVVLQGPAGDIACMRVVQADGGDSLTLLGDAAARADGIEDLDALHALCGGE